MDASHGRFTTREIATKIFNQLPPPRTKRIPTLRSVKNHVWTFLRNHRRHGNVRPVVVKGTKAQGWEWIAAPVPVSSSVPPTRTAGRSARGRLIRRVETKG